MQVSVSGPVRPHQ